MILASMRAWLSIQIQIYLDIVNKLYVLSIVTLSFFKQIVYNMFIPSYYNYALY